MKKKDILALSTYEEFNKCRQKISIRDLDEETRKHIRSLFPKVNGTMEELSKTPGGTIGR